MALDDHARREVDAELLGQDLGALDLVDAAAIGQEDEGDVLLLEVVEGLLRALQRRPTTEEDAIDASFS